jgi:hypothetical protein
MTAGCSAGIARATRNALCADAHGFSLHAGVC